MTRVLPQSPAPTHAPHRRVSADLSDVKPARLQRPDIDGLRGVTVLSILAVHTFPDWMRGGLIGIDIFFVLSGYLISTSVLGAIRSGQFRYGDFYQRRILRIVPALSVVLLAVLAFATLFTFPNETRLVARGVATASTFMSYAFARHDLATYANPVADPLAHLWTLSIEAWFYVTWPLAVVALCRAGRLTSRTIAAAATSLILLTLVLALDRPATELFLLPLRAGELLAGAWLALQGGESMAARLAARWGQAPRWRGRVASSMGWGGSALLAVALVLADRADQCPAAWSLLPFAGTMLLVAAGASAGPNRSVLSHPALRFYGVISYPLYLWHWPLFVFPLIVGVPLSNDVRVMILIASVSLAALTHELVERPIKLVRPTLPMAFGWLLALGCVGAAGMVLTEWADRQNHVASDCAEQGDDSGPCSWRSRQPPSR